ncbi:hypothetical protein HHI36_013612 [Cryptolaemus montrouzieri]|uniref:Uncharacterized protein n=1 Tax=Cryptolaemus montrouzieri TaxID=559131 RepID=A0ABD2NIR4_9CUCU
MSVDNTPQNMNVLSDKLSYDALSPNFHIQSYREHDSLHGLNNNFSKDINLSPLDVNFRNTQIFAVPINVLPPPPHKIVHFQKNIINKKIDNKDGKNKDLRSDNRAVSPKGYESDESTKSLLYTSKCNQQSIKNFEKLGKRNSRNNNQNGKMNSLQ